MRPRLTTVRRDRASFRFRSRMARTENARTVSILIFPDVKESRRCDLLFLRKALREAGVGLPVDAGAGRKEWLS